MANNYYNFPIAFVPGTKVRSEQVNIQYQGLESAFDLLPASPAALIIGTAWLGVDVQGATVNDYLITTPDPQSSLTNGQRVAFFATHTNIGAVTFNIDGLGVINAVDNDGTALVANDVISGQYYEFVYDNANTQWVRSLAGSDLVIGGADTNVQFNDSGAFGGSANFTWDGSALDITGAITVSGNVDGRDVSADGATQDAHIADATIHFLEGTIDHTAILNIGANTHAQIDTAITNSVAHIADGTIHFTQAAISITESQISDLQPYLLAGDQITVLDATADRMFYSDNSGNVSEITLGGAAEVLTSNGLTSAPSFQAASGGGNVSNTGVPLNNQIAVWTNVTTVEGDAGLTWDGATLAVTGDITCNAFTSTGIDDNATAEMMQINDNSMVLGDGTLDFIVRTVDNDTRLTVRSGSGASIGSGIVMYGPNDPGTRDSDFEIVSENDVIADWDKSAGEWSFFAGGGTPAIAMRMSGLTSAGVVQIIQRLLTAASSTGRSGLTLPHGTAPSSPNDGDMWTTTAGLFVRINGSTVGPLT